VSASGKSGKVAWGGKIKIKRFERLMSGKERAGEEGGRGAGRNGRRKNNVHESW
jgi:hypothetical protein